MVSVPCYKCKGKLLCGREFCPVYSRYRAMSKAMELASLDMLSTSPPAIFIGSKLCYPKVNVGILVPPQKTEQASIYENPKLWVEKNFAIKKIVELRSSLINSRFKANVHEARSLTRKLISLQEIAMSCTTTDVEIKLKKKPSFSLKFDGVTMPFGASATLQNFELAENPNIPRLIEKIYYDTDLKAEEAVFMLNKKGFDEHKIVQLFSTGILGLKKNRKLVSTRWGITAIDDILAKRYMQEIKHHETLENWQLFYGNYFGNHYIVLLFPRVFAYELFELYLPGSVWNFTGSIEIATDFEDFYGRKTYAENTVGGYYAARLALLEYLLAIKKQAACLMIRFETPEYAAPLGVWVVRNAARNAFKNSPMMFENLKLALEKAKEIALKNFNFNLDNILKESKLLRLIKEQKLLTSY